MKHVDFWFDPISPYAYLAFEHLPRALEGVPVTVSYKPLLFAGLLHHWGHKGPAEIEPKRRWTMRHVMWHARALGIEMKMPKVHPFNPLPLLRLIVAAGARREVVEAVMRYAWQRGADPSDPERLAELTAHLKPSSDPASGVVKHALRANTDAAIRAGVFGVPTFVLDTKLFWGLDALPLLKAALEGDPVFEEPEWNDSFSMPQGVAR